MNSIKEILNPFVDEFTSEKDFDDACEQIDKQLTSPAVREAAERVVEVSKGKNSPKSVKDAIRELAAVLAAEGERKEERT